MLVDVFVIARRAARLLDRVFDDRDNRVIGETALARTVVVHDVAETQRALLLHQKNSRVEKSPCGARCAEPRKAAMRECRIRNWASNAEGKCR